MVPNTRYVCILSIRYLLRSARQPRTCLVVVDVQNDFITGSLALAGGEEVVPVINEMLDTYSFDLVFYSLDWHPHDHCSYITNVAKYNVDVSSPISAEVQCLHLTKLSS